MQQLVHLAKSSALAFVVLVLSTISPATTLTTHYVSAESTPESTNTTAPVASQPADSSNVAPATPSTYQQNTTTGAWENDQYSWDPNTQQTTPKSSTGTSYNPETSHWDMNDYKYDPCSNKYIENVPMPATQSVPSKPSGNNQINGSNTMNGTFDTFYDANISNKTTSLAESGDASVTGNTLACNANSGDAMAVANIINLLQSSSGFSGNGTITTFNRDINGDVIGDLHIDPSLLTLQPVSNFPSNLSNATNLKIRTDTNGKIDNDITLKAKSGDAIVSGNTKAGDATTGNATAMVNLMNVINSVIGSGQSFLGSLNIYGSLDGDILVPNSNQNSLITASGPNSNSAVNDSDSNNSKATYNDTTTIKNNIDTIAISGNADVSNNTKAGDATTGSTGTNVNVLNLTNREVVANNAVLVFVNVLGSWMGLILDAPSGSTSAAVGNNVTQNKMNSFDADIEGTSTSLISNNVRIDAESGDATVSGNTVGGNAKSGTTKASVNVANLVNSRLALSDWFGVLFINVFGSWNGSFGVDTAAGTLNDSLPAAVGSNDTGGSVFSFAPKQAVSTTTTRQFFAHNPSTTNYIGTNGSGTSEPAGEVISTSFAPASVGEEKNEVLNATSSDLAAVNGKRIDWTIPAIGMTIGLLLLGLERLLAFRQHRNI